jgi:rhamnosyltransferase subunit B
VSRILLTTFGSYGDLHPYLAMTHAFRALGHEVVLATHADYREFAERAGAKFVAMRPSLADVGPEEQWTRTANHPRRGIEFICRQLILPYLESNYEAVMPVARNCDLLVSHLLTFATPVVAEKLRAPWFSVALQPAVFLSVVDPPAVPVWPALPDMPKWVVRGFYRLARLATRSWFQPVQDLRARVGLPPAPHPMFDGFSPHGTLALFPAEFATPQADWPSGVRQVGFPLFDTEHSPHLSAETQSFLDAGEAPVVFTLGSSIARMQSDFFETAHRAVQRSRRRAVFLAGIRREAVAQAIGADANVLVAGYEPHSQLFPHAAAIVHQCGIGTTAQALASGRPQVAVPFAHDQPDNARRVAARGLGVVIPAGSLTTDRLAQALETVSGGEFPARAKAFAARIPRAGFAARLEAALLDQSTVSL